MFTVDSTANRLLVFDVASITDGEAAINVLGQADFTSNGSDYGGGLVSDGKGGFIQTPGATGFNQPYASSFDSTNERLFVSDVINNRILVFDLSASAVVAGSGWSYIQPPLCDAGASPAEIVEGESTTLSWNVTWPTPAQNTYYVNVPGEGLYSHNVSSIDIYPEHSTTYNIAIFNLWGANFCEATVIVLDEDGEEVASEDGGYLTAGVSNSPFVKAILGFFKKIFVK